MILDLKVSKGTFTKGLDKDNNIVYRCNFITEDDDTITLFLNEKEVEPYLNLKRYAECNVKIKVYRCIKNDGKYNFTKGWNL